MSTLEVNKLAPLANNGTITLGDSGDTFDVPSGATLDVTGATISGLSTGKIGQVVTTTFTGTESTTTEATSNTYTNSSVAATITPTAASSKIMVMCTINAGSTDSSNGVHIGRFTQAISGGSTTAVFIGDAASNRVRTSSGRGSASTNENTLLVLGFNFVLTPSTTSAVTVTYQFTARGAAGSNLVYINRTASDSDTTEYQRAASAITLMEVLA